MNGPHTHFWRWPEPRLWQRVYMRLRYSLALVFSRIVNSLRWRENLEPRAPSDTKATIEEAPQVDTFSTKEYVMSPQDLEEVASYVDDIRTGKIKWPTGQKSVSAFGRKIHIDLIMEREYHVNPKKWYTIAGGVTSAVKVMTCRALNDKGEASVMKLPHPWEPDAGRELEIESEVYRRIGPHPRLVDFRWGSSSGICLKYLPNGDLREYLKKHPETAEDVRLRWASEAAEGLQLLHDVGVIQSDTASKNYLVDDDLSLKICDFSGSSLDGSKPTVNTGVRSAAVTPTGPKWYAVPSVQTDLFALGAVIYEIMTGSMPYEDLSSDEVRPLFRNHQFPDVTKISCGGVISECWFGRYDSAQQVQEAVDLIRFNPKSGPA